MHSFRELSSGHEQTACGKKRKRKSRDSGAPAEGPAPDVTSSVSKAGKAFTAATWASSPPTLEATAWLERLCTCRCIVRCCHKRRNGDPPTIPKALIGGDLSTMRESKDVRHAPKKRPVFFAEGPPTKHVFFGPKTRPFLTNKGVEMKRARYLRHPQCTKKMSFFVQGQKG
jgi:hypothetical protein